MRSRKSVWRRTVDLDFEAHRVVGHFAADDEPGAANLGMPASDLRHLRRVHEHAAYLGRLVGPAQPAANALVGTAGRADPGQQRREIAGAETDQRVIGIERRHHDLADIAQRHDVAGARTHDLEDHAFVDDQALARFGFVGDEAQVGGAVALVRRDAARRKAVAQGGRKSFAADRGFRQRGKRNAELVGFFEQQPEETRGADVAIGPQRRHRLHLQIGLAGAGGEHGAADRVGTAFHHRAGRREVVAEGVVDEVAGAKAGREQGAAHAPVVGARAVGLVDRPGRREDTRRPPRRVATSAPADCGKAAEHVAASRRSLALEQLVLAQNGKPGERGSAVDSARIDVAQTFREGRRVRLRVRDLRGERAHELGLSPRRLACFERVEEFGGVAHGRSAHSSSSRLARSFASSTSLRCCAAVSSG